MMMTNAVEIQPLLPWAMSDPSTKFNQNHFISFSVIHLTKTTGQILPQPPSSAELKKTTYCI